MDDLRSNRRRLWFTVIIVNLIIAGGLVLFLYKRCSPAENKSVGEKLDTNITETHPLTISEYETKDMSGFERSTEWEEFRTDGPLSASAADFHKGDDCVRVVLFLGRGVLLGHVHEECDSLEPSMGLVEVNNSLYHYRKAMATLGPAEDTFKVVEKVLGERRCLVANYTITEGDGPTLKEKSEHRQVFWKEDKDCETLVDFEMPRMVLLSRSGYTGNFLPVSSITTINPWEPVGLVTRGYYFGARCFRLLVITSFGRGVQAVKVTCGPIQNMVITNNTLYYGDAMVVRRNPVDDAFTFIFNPKGKRDCFKKTVSLKNKDGRSLLYVKSKKALSKDDKECLDLIKGEIDQAVVPKNIISHLETTLAFDKFGVEPYGGSLKGYEPYNEWSSVNLSMDLGLAVRFYMTSDGGELRKLALVVANGVPLAAAFDHPHSVQRLVMRGDVLYYNTTIMVKKEEGENKYSTLVKVDEQTCYRKSYVVKSGDGILLREELPSGGKVGKHTDEDCWDLIDGRKLIHVDHAKFGVETDAMGVPKEMSGT